MEVGCWFELRCSYRLIVQMARLPSRENLWELTGELWSNWKASKRDWMARVRNGIGFGKNVLHLPYPTNKEYIFMRTYAGSNFLPCIGGVIIG